MSALLLVFGLLFIALAAVAATLLLFLLVGLLPVFLLILIYGAAIGLFIFWVWMLVDAIQNRGLSEGEKIGWVLAIVFLHPIAAILYLFLGWPKRKMLAPA